jgi:hypothetical protein
VDKQVQIWPLVWKSLRVADLGQGSMLRYVRTNIKSTNQIRNFFTFSVTLVTRFHVYQDLEVLHQIPGIEQVKRM